MRGLLLTLALLTLGADYPQHRRFLQRSLPRGASCVPATGGPVTNTGWRVQTTGGGLVITEGVGPSPGCANDSTQITPTATSGGSVSIITDDGSVPAHICPSVAGHVSIGVWVKASTPGVTDLCTNDPQDGWLCYALSYSAGTALYKFEDKPFWIGTSSVAIGNASLINGGVSRSALTFEVWGARCNAGATLNP